MSNQTTVPRQAPQADPGRTAPLRRAAANQAGFTLIEIIIAFIIIGILTAILVPTIAKRSEDAKVAAANQDLQHLADAEERCTIDIGYIVRPYALNDVRRGDGIANADPLSKVNGLADEADTVPFYLYKFSDQMFISPTTEQFLPQATQKAIFQRLVTNETDISSQWRGPYLNWQRDINHNDWPDDPWGNDYLFFMRGGILYPPVHGAAPPLDDDTTTAFQPSDAAGQQVVNLFDRPTFLSLGPDGVPGSAADPVYGHGDDLVRSFGGQ